MQYNFDTDVTEFKLAIQYIASFLYDEPSEKNYADDIFKLLESSKENHFAEEDFNVLRTPAAIEAKKASLHTTMLTIDPFEYADRGLSTRKTNINYVKVLADEIIKSDKWKEIAETRERLHVTRELMHIEESMHKIMDTDIIEAGHMLFRYESIIHEYEEDLVDSIDIVDGRILPRSLAYLYSDYRANQASIPYKYRKMIKEIILKGIKLFEISTLDSKKEYREKVNKCCNSIIYEFEGFIRRTRPIEDTWEDWFVYYELEYDKNDNKYIIRSLEDNSITKYDAATLAYYNQVYCIPQEPPCDFGRYDEYGYDD